MRNYDVDNDCITGVYDTKLVNFEGNIFEKLNKVSYFVKVNYINTLKHEKRERNREKIIFEKITNC